MAVDFFLDLLKDLTTSMSKREKKIVQEKNEREILLDLESEMDEAVKKIQRQLMTVRLISLLSEDEKLQEALMENPTRKLQFLMSTLQRGNKTFMQTVFTILQFIVLFAAAVMCKERLDQMCPLEDKDPAELQSLTMAVSLLKHHLTQKGHQVKAGEWTQLQECAEDLRYLSENYEDKSVSLLCGRLREHIVTRGAVDMEADDQKSTEVHKKIQELKIDTYESALNDATETEVPVRGHGLIVLTRYAYSICSL